MYGYVNQEDLLYFNKTQFTFSEVAKIINKKNLGRNNLLKILRKKGILNANNSARQDLITKGLFKIITSRKGNTNYFIATQVTKKGIEFIRSILS